MGTVVGQEGGRRTTVNYPLDWLRQMRFEPTVGLLRKSTVYGLNGHSALFVIDLSLVTYEDAI
jgi:hypothetical protein